MIVQCALVVLRLGEVVRERLVVLGDPVRVELFDRGADDAVQRPAPPAQQAVVGDFVRQGVLEHVGELVGVRGAQLRQHRRDVVQAARTAMVADSTASTMGRAWRYSSRPASVGAS